MISGYWSQWYDEDTPRNGVGDTETIEAIKQVNFILLYTRQYTGIVYTFAAPEFTPVFLSSVRVTRSLVL
jgi:hypothetical protein